MDPNTIKEVEALVAEIIKAADLPPWEKFEFNPPTKQLGFTLQVRRTDDPDAMLDHIEDKISVCQWVNKRMAGETAERPKLHSPYVEKMVEKADNAKDFTPAADYCKGAK